MTDKARPLVATYRLQLRPDFGFAEAEAVVPYLAKLGVSHLYLSPIWQAAAGSAHGYDVVDHSRISHELGGQAGFLRLVEAAHRHDLGIVLDIVPNHVGIQGGVHPWWRDVLRYGMASPFAAHFDIDWEGQPQMRPGILLVPSLGRPRGAALEAGEFTLDFDEHDLVIRYYEASYPLSPRTYYVALGMPSGAALEHADHTRLQDVVESLDRLRDAAPESADILRTRLIEHLRADAALGEWAHERLASLNGTPGDPASFDRLDDLMREQHYRLASWRVSGEETNYRRFFDVNDLAAIRAEHQPVFDDTHRLVREFIESGMIDGLRVDHVDGLYNPSQYLRQLEEMGARSPAGSIPTWVEKILGHGEALPDWPVQGTTGYEFLAVAGGLQVSSDSESSMSHTYDEFTARETFYDEVSFTARQRIAERSFSGEVAVLALQLHRLAQRDRRNQDNTLRSLHDAIAALLASFPVYRTYLDDGESRAGDRDLLTTAAHSALSRAPDVTPESMAFLVSVLLLEDADHPEERVKRVHFRRRFQQVSGPVMAKGVEDTTFFRYHRLLALNEVGAHPDHFGLTVDAAHEQFALWGRDWPGMMLATSTHDTKRSEDARARLHVLSEIPDAWRRAVRSFQRGNRRWKPLLGDRPVPGPNTEYYLYQTLVASWGGKLDGAYRERVREHMRKAMRESKVHTSWATVVPEYEDAVLEFVSRILSPRRATRFVERMDRLMERISGPAAVNSLATVTLKSTVPGVPDFYNGTELPFFALTDPDNRRPVDFAGAEASLAGFDADNAEIPAPSQPAVKQWLTVKLLELRRERIEVFSDGSNYQPLQASGPRSSHLFAYARTAGEQTVMVIVPRLTHGLVDERGRFLPGSLANSTVHAPFAGSWTNLLTGEGHTGEQFEAGALLGAFPVAVLVLTSTLEGRE